MRQIQMGACAYTNPLYDPDCSNWALEWVKKL